MLELALYLCVYSPTQIYIDLKSSKCKLLHEHTRGPGILHYEGPSILSTSIAFFMSFIIIHYN